MAKSITKTKLRAGWYQISNGRCHANLRHGKIAPDAWVGWFVEVFRKGQTVITMEGPYRTLREAQETAEDYMERYGG